MGSLGEESGGEKLPLGDSDLGWRSITGLDGYGWRPCCPWPKEKGRLERPVGAPWGGGIYILTLNSSCVGSSAVMDRQSRPSRAVVRVH
jgi:hypothetical protein